MIEWMNSSTRAGETAEETKRAGWRDWEGRNEIVVYFRLPHSVFRKSNDAELALAPVEDKQIDHVRITFPPHCLRH